MTFSTIYESVCEVIFYEVFMVRNPSILNDLYDWLTSTGNECF